MDGTTTAAKPVEQLREQAKRLEAALSVGLANPTTKAVHDLRSAARRVEAQLSLLAMVHGLPAYKPAAKRLQGRLDKLRRVAGYVRDCDVQEKLLKDGNHLMNFAVEAPADLDKAQNKLRKKVDKARQSGEKDLLAAIEKQLPKLARDTEAVLKCLKSAEDHQAPVTDLLNSIKLQMTRVLRSHERGEDHLHDIRKAAKRARYQCESMPGPQAAAMAKRLEALQDAGGSWHDLLDLATVCHQHFGSEHPLSRVLEHRRDERLDKYLADLDDFRKNHTHISAAASKRKPPQRSPSASRSAPARRLRSARAN
jgi:CHAD domain-containing protein